MENIKELLLLYIPSITTLIAFIAAGISFLRALKKSDVTTIAEAIKDENSEINHNINELINLSKQLMAENRELKQTNSKLLAEIKRISGYGEE